MKASTIQCVNIVKQSTISAISRTNASGRLRFQPLPQSVESLRKAVRRHRQATWVAHRIPPGTRHRHRCLFGGNAAYCEWLRTESDEIAQNCSLFARSPPRGSFVDMRPFACDTL